MSVIVRTSNVSAGYNGKPIWNNADISIERGDFIGLLGANGAGKSTLFRLLLGLERPLSGQMEVFGAKPRRGNPAIGYVPQRRFIDNESKLLAIDYIRLGTYLNKWGFSLPKQARGELLQAQEALELVDGLNLANKPLSDLSGGEQQRVFLAQALVGKPQLLLLDEPLANLDIRREAQLIRLVNKIARQQNLAVVLIAHDINPLLPVVNRIIYIASGKVVSGLPEDIINGPSLSSLYGAPIEVLKDSKGRVAVLGVEEAIHHAD